MKIVNTFAPFDVSGRLKLGCTGCPHRTARILKGPSPAPCPTPQFGLAWRIGANETDINTVNTDLLKLVEDGTVSQASRAQQPAAACPASAHAACHVPLLPAGLRWVRSMPACTKQASTLRVASRHSPVPPAALVQLRDIYIAVDRSECESGINDQTAITFEQVSGARRGEGGSARMEAVSGPAPGCHIELEALRCTRASSRVSNSCRLGPSRTFLFAPAPAQACGSSWQPRWALPCSGCWACERGQRTRRGGGGRRRWPPSWPTPTPMQAWRGGSMRARTAASMGRSRARGSGGTTRPVWRSGRPSRSTGLR